MSTNTKTGAPGQVDVRGPRFAAWVTTVVIVATLIVSAFSNAGAAVVLGLQAVVFAIGAWPVTEKEPVPPLKFAQLVGFVFAVVGVIGFACGLPLLGLIATGFALIAALLNAAFGICLGCQLYPLVARLRRAPSPA